MISKANFLSKAAAAADKFEEAELTAQELDSVSGGSTVGYNQIAFRDYTYHEITYTDTPPPPPYNQIA